MKRLNLNTDTTLNSNSNTLASSQKAIKAYADTKLSKTDAENTYLPLTGGTINGVLKVVGPLSEINTFSGDEVNGYTRLSLISKDGNWAELKLINRKGETNLIQADSGKTEIYNSLNKKTFKIGTILEFNNNKVLDASDKAVANGVASLDENAKVPENQLPDTVTNQAILREW